MAGEHWKNKPEPQDFPAAESYLSLLVGPTMAAKLARALKKEDTVRHYAAKDILRAARLPLLAPDDSEVAADLEKVKSGRRLSPYCWSMAARSGLPMATTASAPAITSTRRRRCPAGWWGSRPDILLTRGLFPHTARVLARERDPAAMRALRRT